jgi:hypothetical protein
MNIAAARQLFDELQGYQLGGIACLWSAAWRLCFIASAI